MNKKRRDSIAASQISEIKTYTLGGHEQKVLIEGMSKDAPIMLFLHGGPGSPIPFSVGARGMYPEYAKHFIAVYWDQLGCGINNHIIDDTFSIDSFVDMTTDLIMALRNEFPNNRMFLMAVSWGSILAAKAAAKMPDSIDGVVVYGQILSHLFFNEEVFSALLVSDAPPKAKERAGALRTQKSYNFADIQSMGGLIRKYTDGYQCKAGGVLPLGKILRGLLASPDYSFKDFIAVLKPGFMKDAHIWDELVATDLHDTLQEIRIPYRIIQGSTDLVTSTKAVARFVDTCGNPHLSLRVVPNNGHIPGPSCMDEVLLESVNLAQQVE